jgi:hypothetical protein
MEFCFAILVSHFAGLIKPLLGMVGFRNKIKSLLQQGVKWNEM